MRILAPRKRDSVTGEDVVVAVSHVVTSSGYNNSNNNLLSNSTGGGVILAVTESSLVVAGSKFGGGSGVVRGFVAGGVEKDSKLFPSGKRCKKSKGGAVGTVKGQRRRGWVGSSDAEERIKSHWDKSAAFLRDYCCAWKRQEAEKEDSGYLHNHQQEKTSSCSEKARQEAGLSSSSIVTNSSSVNSTAVILCERNTNNINVEDTNLRNTCTQSRLLETGTAASTIENMRAGIYHEKQVKSLCALHALNNLLQDGKAFKQEDLDKICSELDPNSWVNPHKSVFGLGNYDINVIMTALQQKRLEAVWFDKRKDPSEELNFDNIYGFILNIPSECKLGWLALPIKRKHWVAIRNLPSVTERDTGRSNYYNLDSKFDKPESIGTTDNLIEYLRSELRSPEKELFLVVVEEVGRIETWRKNPPPLPSMAPPPSTEPGAAVLASSSSSTSNNNAGIEASPAATVTNLLPVPGDCLETSAGSGANRRTSNDSGVVDLLPDLRDINVVDLNKEDLMRRQSSGVWSDLT